ncbi:5'-3' exoribonuclease 2 [Meyerozyma sp. JA9]|nr:5'-3' exoribonuclease 2 [Meyerozyma sp. JA9]
MGVPALFRWLSRKYPKIITPVYEDPPEEIGAPQYSDPNPNGELDNLYLDMNGIVHPCSHPEHKPAPETEDEMFLDVFKYTDRVLMMARPRKVLMIAVDGVAPRAKMNQQRSRRFRSAQEAKIAHEEKQRQIKERELRGESIDEAIKGKRSWDSNAITPGTPFMDKLAAALRYWVAYKLTSDPGWANVQVIISDATVPGEGEHKIMNFIRSQRSDPEYDPNTKHCIYGLDADLIFLGLATHEPHFRVLREDVFANQTRQLRVSDQISMTQEQKDSLAAQDARKPFLWLHINVLREYLETELFVPHLPFTFDVERAIDDWIFMCFFVGNDFLPHLPSLDVRDNGIDILLGCWKRVLPKLKGYITCDGNLNAESVEKLMNALTYKEAEIFRKRHEQEKRREENDKRRKVFQEEDRALRNQYLSQVSKGQDKAPLVADTQMPLMTTSGEVVDGYAKLSNRDIVHHRDVITKANMSNAEAAAELKKLLDGGTDTSTDPQDSETNEQAGASDTSEQTSRKRPLESEPPTPDENGDAVRMWEPGYHDRYYQTKFHLTTQEEIDETRRGLVRSYLEGISWVLLYYYQGCPSWQWYYPYHYAPFAADFVNVSDIIGEEGIKFDLGTPFRPYEQLMAVLPAASGHNLPAVFRDLMSNPDSPIIDFYPEEFEIDMNGKKMSWQGIALLPFIEEKRLLSVLETKYPELTDDERDRNTIKSEVLVMSSQNVNYDRFSEVYKTTDEKTITFGCGATNLAGIVFKNNHFQLEGLTQFPLSFGDMPDIDNAEYFLSSYHMPPKKRGKSMLLRGYISHQPVLTQDDKNTIIYGSRNNGGGNRFRSPNDNRDYVNSGPMGSEIYKVYSMRRGGYRAFIEMQSQAQNYQNPNGYQNGHQGYQGNQANQGYQGHNQGYGNQGYNRNQGYQGNQYNQNQGYQNQNYNQNYNQGNQGYSRYNQGGYNQGYQSQGYQNQGYQGARRGNRGGFGSQRSSYRR